MVQEMNVPRFIANDMCTLSKDAIKVQMKLKEFIRNKKVTRVSFAGASLIITRFVNVAIGQLLSEFSMEQFERYILIDYRELDEIDKNLIERSIHSAKQFYSNRTQMEERERNLLNAVAVG